MTKMIFCNCLKSLFYVSLIVFLSFCTIDRSDDEEKAKLLTKLDSVFNPSILSEEFDYNQDDLAKYDQWIEEVLSYSITNKGKVIIINKSAYDLYLIDSGLVIKIYPIELGGDPINEKIQEDYKTTPEGHYTASKLSWTNFYKALLLNYPNEYNWQNFNHAKKLGMINENANIGGNIEIHGIGTGKRPGEGGNNWTWGCIAMSNNDIDDLFEQISSDIKVTIVRYTSKELEKKDE